MMLKVKTLTGREVEVNIEPESFVSDLKKAVEAESGIPPAQQRLIFGGKNMSDEKRIKDYDQLEPGGTVHLVLALRGGQ